MICDKKEGREVLNILVFFLDVIYERTQTELLPIKMHEK